MRTKWPVFLFAVLALCAFGAAGAELPTAGEKARVRAIIKEIGAVSRRCRTLDDFGRDTVEQGKEILSMGGCAVYALSNCLDNPDWKVRFWIVDMMGYLENPDARRPLERTMNDENEAEAVRQQAEESMGRLDESFERNIR